MGPVTLNLVPPPTIGTDSVALPKLSVRWLRSAASKDCCSKPMETLNTPALLGFFKRYPNFPSGMVIRKVSSVSPERLVMNLAVLSGPHDIRPRGSDCRRGLGT